MSDPFRDEETALEERMRQLFEEIEDLRARLSAFEGENRDAVIAAQLTVLRSDIEQLTIERDQLRAELRLATANEL
jgi:hypothetical protein